VRRGNPRPSAPASLTDVLVSNPPTKDVKIRQAIAAAVDPKVINERGYQGKGLVGNQLFQSDFRWFADVAGPKFDVEAAKKLVTEAKNAGWDGKLRLLYNSSPTAAAVGLATQTMLQNVGMTVALDTSKDTNAQIVQVTSLKDFDVTGWGMAIPPDDGAVWALAQNLASTSTSNRIGFKSSVVDQALKDIRQAKTDDEKKAAYKKIAEVVHGRSSGASVRQDRRVHRVGAEHPRDDSNRPFRCGLQQGLDRQVAVFRTAAARRRLLAAAVCVLPVEQSETTRGARHAGKGKCGVEG
jgi:ABC-type transport system substrate-binding protein